MVKNLLLLATLVAQTSSRTVSGFSATLPPRTAPKTSSSGNKDERELTSIQQHDRIKEQVLQIPKSDVARHRPPSVLVPWPHSPVEANGDYREELFLEKLIGGPLYSKQDVLPRLPVASIRETIPRLIPTALPLAVDKQERESFLQACKDFPTQAQHLQERLLKRQDEYNMDSSWLQDWWMKRGYLQMRDPLAVKISYYLLVGDDAKAPISGLARGAAMLVSLAESRKQICSGKMSYESIQSNKDNKEEQPLCSTGFKYLFHSSRIPQLDQDKYHLHDPSLYKHCIVACQGQFFAVDFVDDQDDPLPLTLLERRLQRCQELASSSSTQQHQPQLGWLTSSDRDTWAKARAELLKVGGDTMQEALTGLESGAFVLNLDEDEPESWTDACKVFWYGGDKSGGNRWFDKAMQLICTKNGRVAYMGEHSMLDAAPTIPLITRIMKTTYTRLLKKQQTKDLTEVSAEEVNAGVTNVFEECWKSPSLVETASKLARIAKNDHAKLTNDYDLEVEHFTGYGKKFVKQAGFLGPEYAQLAIQLASYRLFDKTLVATYEAALTRSFLHGRTETSRPVSPETLAFVQAMDNKSDDSEMRQEKLAMLQQAASSFAEYQSNASKGMGVDRHLLGLSWCMDQKEEPRPALFSDPLYQRAKTFRLGTSSVIFCPGFGPMTDDGIGVGFNVASDSFMFTCNSRKENQYLPKFCELLHEALIEMGDLLKES